jgi:ABC-type branched-subunit amino acid transport system substrate-binding protein
MRCVGLGVVTALLVALVTAGGACSTSSSSSAAPLTGDDAAPIVIGVSDTLTGGLSGVGIPFQNAVKVAEQYINSLGGVLGRPLRFVVMDDMTDEGAILEQTIASLLGQGAVAIIGPNGSGQVSYLQPMLTEQKVLEVSASATAADLISSDDPLDHHFFFRTCPSDSLQGEAVVDFAVAGPNGIGGDGGGPVACSRMAIVYLSNTYGISMKAVIDAAFPVKSNGGSIVSEQSVDVTVMSDYSAIIDGIEAATPDCLVAIVYDDVADAFLQQLDAAITPSPPGWSPSFFVIGTDGVYTNNFIVNGRLNAADAGSANVANGVYGTSPDSSPPTNNYNDFRNLYLAQFSLTSGESDLDPYTANEFDAAILLALAIEKAGTATDSTKIRDAYLQIGMVTSNSYGPSQVLDALAAIRRGEDVHYLGASGNLALQSDGNVLAGYLIWTVVDGRYQTIARITADDL